MASTSTSEEKKLFIGNLSSSCDEYTLVKLFSRYGQISKLDYMFHTSGPLKGKPRGYAFVEFVKKEDALTALVETNDKLIRGQKLTVSLAKAAPVTAEKRAGPRRPKPNPIKPTLLSIQKQSKSTSTDAKIRALEAKLNAMKSESPVVPLPGEQGSSLQPAPSSAGLPLRPKQTYKPPTLEQAVLDRAEIVNEAESSAISEAIDSDTMEATGQSATEIQAEEKPELPLFFIDSLPYHSTSSKVAPRSSGPTKLPIIGLSEFT